ncbi:MAG: 5-methyltetrahydrofolate--homocysteine methyltransferase [Bacteroidaceae bacterium]|nr:5-methyltetrahydrofolate--homocysteine methyltransferase [Bacteroidaceae bacterium]
MNRTVFHYSTSEVAPYIDWSYFLHAWRVKPQTATAEELIADAKGMLQALEGKYRTHALFALCDARGDGDNIIIEDTTLPQLRQQHCHDGKPNLCLSDFVSPYGDKVGVFATTVDKGFGTEYKDDEYLDIMAQALADRLAEATATLMHKTVRTQKVLWGYAPDERLTVDELNREEFQGIRPAVGYPSLPDQSVIFILDSILQMNGIGIELTPNGAMSPHSSVCGIMISHPAAQYFAIEKIGEEQLHDYARRRGLPVNELRKYLARNLQ